MGNNEILKQHDLKWIGSFIHVLYLTMPLMGAISYTMSAITMYTVLLPYIKDAMPWFTAPMFFSGCLILCLILLFTFYKFIYPSYMTFQNRQEYTHNSLIRKDLEEIKKTLGIK